jgi:hypothetical protein
LIPKGYVGITMYPFVLLKTSALRNNEVLLNHENIHLRQQLELLIIPFYIIYVVEFFVRFVQYRNWQLAYKNISFEREAYKHENDLGYVNSRKFWQFLKYLRSDAI